MNARRQGFTGDLMWVALSHGLLIGAILTIALFKGCSDPTPITMPMELLVEPPPDDGDDQPAPPRDDTKPPEPEPDKNDIPEPEKEKKVESRKVEPKKVEPRKVEPKKNKIEVNKTLVRRPVKRKSNLTAAEVQRLLDQGAKIGKPTLSDRDLRNLLNSDRRYGEGKSMTQDMVYLDAIKQTMYRAWDQPTSLGIAGLVARVEFTFNPDGSISGSRLTSPSGNPTMDDSVMRAAKSVRRVTGVPADYFISHRRIAVVFELTGGN